LANPWPACPKLPRHAAAVLGALHLDSPDFEALERLTEREWRDALDYADRERVTLLLRDTARAHMPEWVRERVDRDAAKNQIRLTGIRQTYRDVADWLTGAGLEFIFLKGITHAALFGTPGTAGESRVQYDIDLWLPRESALAAQKLLAGHGYESLPGTGDLPTDHLPSLIRKTGWQWRGDFFDAEIPLAVELHFQFWNPRLERFDAPGAAGFWNRRTTRRLAGADLGTLYPPDAVAYACLHLLKHVLQGSARSAHVHEIAAVLNARAGDAALWEEWRSLHPAGLRRLEAVIFGLAREWFGGQAAAIVEEEIALLPEGVQTWLAMFAASPATQRFHANKDDLWLHMSLVESRAAALRIALDRLVPHSIPVLAGDAYIPKDQLTLRDRIYWSRRRVAYIAGRVRHHTAALPATARSGVRWWWRTNSLGRQFWMFLVAAVVFNFALFIFVLLYNLFLMERGFREDFLGVVSGAQRVGSVVGTLPAAWVAHRFGLRKSLLLAFVGVSLSEVLRAVVVARLPLAALGFGNGCIFSLWAVIMAPCIAATTHEKRRPVAFSVFFAAMFTTGIAGNWIGGRLPMWLHGKQPVLLCAAAISVAALIPVWRLRLPAAPATRAHVYPRTTFLLRFLAPFALWHLATGAFNPFHNVYFARMGFAVKSIGSIFSASQVVQVVTVLLAPWVIRRLGMVTGVACMMAATALSLTGLASQPPASAAVAVYIAYMSFQWMSEPGLNTLLMNNVDEKERSGASAITFLVAFGAQALASFGAGAGFTNLGYGAVLGGAAALAAISAVLFRLLLRPALSAPVAADGIATE
jgi:MFS family permease